MALTSNGRQELKDQKFDENVEGGIFVNKLFLRLVAKDVRFTSVDFKYTIFDACYIRNCYFDSCDFTGCRFINSNFHGTGFEGCKFDYANFEKTVIDSAILDSNAPSVENLKSRFARSLRVNYQSIGEANSVNRAIRLENFSTLEHLYKAWHSNEAYYRKKYAGIDRLAQFGGWLSFKALDFIWGNGESIYKLSRSILLVLISMTMFDVFNYQNPLSVLDYARSFSSMPSIFLGAKTSANYPELYVAAIALLRLISVSLFVSIIVKRFNRR